jgi:drug/metabolite transporter (DMT)-like permease
VFLVRGRPEFGGGRGRWIAPAALFTYALFFSLAYRGLTAATGALLLFGAVQLTMLLVAFHRGERLVGWQWPGLFAALAGLALLLWPGLAAPPLWATGAMLLAGVAWGVYTLCSGGSGNPTARTAGNFLLASVPALALVAVWAVNTQWDPMGVLLAVLSGAVASGLGYAIWYAALRHIDTHTAAVSQLSVPVLTALGGVLLLAEPLSGRLVLSGMLVLLGIGLVIRGRARRAS